MRSLKLQHIIETMMGKNIDLLALSESSGRVMELLKSIVMIVPLIPTNCN